MYKKIYLILDECINNERIKRNLIEAFDYYQKVKEIEMKDDLFFILYPIQPTAEQMLKQALQEWKSDEEKLKLITGISGFIDDNIIYMISESLEKEESKCFVIDNKLSIMTEMLINSLGIKKKNEYTVKLLGNKFVEFFLELPKDRQIQLFDLLNGKNQTIKNAAADMLYRMNMNDLINTIDNVHAFDIDKDLSIGVELETIGRASDLLLYEADYLVGYKRTILGDEWHVSNDDSLGKYGIEVISPVMHNVEHDLNQLYAICEFLKLIGNVPNEKCGGHIHIGADYLKSKYSLANLYEIIGNCEEIYYLVACEEGKFAPSRIDTSIKPISEKLKLAISSREVSMNLQEFADLLKKVQGTLISEGHSIPDKHYGINILNYGRTKPLSSSGEYIHTGINTIEFRAFTNPETYKGWVENIRLAGKLMEVSEKLAQIDLKQDKSEEEKRMVCLRTKLKEDIPSSEKIEYFLDLIFENDRDKEIYRNRFLANYRILERVENRKVKKKLAFHKIELIGRALDGNKPVFDEESR